MLRQGLENKKIIEMLITISKIRSPDLIKCLLGYYVDGLSLRVCSTKYNVEVANIYRVKHSVEQVNDNIDFILRVRCGLE